MVERLEKRINFALSKIGSELYVSPKQQLDNLSIGIEADDPSILKSAEEDIPHYDELKLFCQYYNNFTCTDTATVKIEKKQYNCKDILKNYTSTCENGVSANLEEAKKNLDDLYTNLIETINEKQNTILNINIKNVDEIHDAYTEYQKLQNNMNEHYTDTVLIDNKNYIMNSKLSYNSNSIKLYAFAIVLLVCANIAFYIKFLKNN